MKNLMQKMKGLAKRELGATMVEYAIMVALIAIVSIAVITGLGQEVSTTFGTVNSALSAANG